MRPVPGGGHLGGGACGRGQGGGQQECGRRAEEGSWGHAGKMGAGSGTGEALMNSVLVRGYESLKRQLAIWPAAEGGGTVAALGTAAAGSALRASAIAGAHSNPRGHDATHR